MRAGIVIPVGGGRLENLTCALKSICEMTEQPELLVLVGDGPEGTEVAEIALDRTRNLFEYTWTEAVVRPIEKHEPGLEQPRNVGVRVIEEVNHRNAMLRQRYPITHVWFLDSDILVDAGALAAYRAVAEPKRVLVGPYDWMPEHHREPIPELKNDPRWPSFDSSPADKVFTEDLSAGLACFSGNLVWPIDEFARIGGFWNEIHHGRCEDGELGLRAVACGVPISLVAAARGWHQGHPIDMEETLRRNYRDVPMLNLRHPWVEGMCKCKHKSSDHAPDGLRPCMACDCVRLEKIVELFVVEEDGRRFNARCACGWEGNTAEIWAHQAGCAA